MVIAIIAFSFYISEHIAEHITERLAIRFGKLRNKDPLKRFH